MLTLFAVLDVIKLYQYQVKFIIKNLHGLIKISNEFYYSASDTGILLEETNNDLT